MMIITSGLGPVDASDAITCTHRLSSTCVATLSVMRRAVATNSSSNTYGRPVLLGSATTDAVQFASAMRDVVSADDTTRPESRSLLCQSRSDVCHSNC